MRKWVQKTAREHAQEPFCKDYTYLVITHTQKQLIVNFSTELYLEEK